MPYDTGWGQFVNSLTNPPNPLSQFGGTVDLANKLKQFQADKAIADIYGQSIDPVTGQVDLGKFNALSQGNPAALWHFGESMKSAGSGLQAQGVGTSAQLQAAQDNLAATAGYMRPLIDDAMNNRPVTAQQVSDALDAIPPGTITPTALANMRQRLAQIGPNGDARGFILGGAFANNVGQSVIKSVLPNYGTIGAGGYQQPYQATPGIKNPVPGFPATPVQQTPSADLLAQPVTVTIGTQTIPNVPYATAVAIQQNPTLLKTLYPSVKYNGEPIEVPPPPPAALPPQVPGGNAPGVPGSAAPPAASGRRPGAAVTNNSFAPGVPPNRAGRYPGEIPATGGAAGATGAAAPPVGATGATGAASPSAGATGATGATEPTPLWQQPPTPTAPSAAAGGVGVTPQPWYVEQVKKTVDAATASQLALQNQVSKTKEIEPILADMKSQLNTPGFETGVGATAVNSVRQLMQRLGVPGSSGEGTTEAMRAQDEFNKNAARLQAAQVDALGNPTDARQELAAAANPGQLQSTYGNKGIVQMLAGNQQAIRAENDAWQKAQAKGWATGGDENNNFNQWRNNRFLATDPGTQGRFDQRVFWFANAPTLDEQKQFANKIPPGNDRLQFVKNLNYAHKMGWIKTDDKGQTTVTNP